jgi:hypothetical protein
MKASHIHKGWPRKSKVRVCIRFRSGWRGTRCDDGLGDDDVPARLHRVHPMRSDITMDIVRGARSAAGDVAPAAGPRKMATGAGQQYSSADVSQ